MNRIDRLYNPFVLISAECDRLNNTLQSYRTECLEIDLIKLKLPFKRVQGCYKGSKEVAFYVECSKPEHVSTLCELSKKYDQESILYVDSTRQGKLIYNTGSTETIGKFKQVDKARAKACECYTHDNVNNGYYICE